MKQKVAKKSVNKPKETYVCVDCHFETQNYVESKFHEKNCGQVTGKIIIDLEVLNIKEKELDSISVLTDSKSSGISQSGSEVDSFGLIDNSRGAQLHSCSISNSSIVKDEKLYKPEEMDVHKFLKCNNNISETPMQSSNISVDYEKSSSSKKNSSKTVTETSTTRSIVSKIPTSNQGQQSKIIVVSPDVIQNFQSCVICSNIRIGDVVHKLECAHLIHGKCMNEDSIFNLLCPVCE